MYDDILDDVERNNPSPGSINPTSGPPPTSAALPVGTSTIIHPAHDTLLVREADLQTGGTHETAVGGKGMDSQDDPYAAAFAPVDPPEEEAGGEEGLVTSQLTVADTEALAVLTDSQDPYAAAFAPVEGSEEVLENDEAATVAVMADSQDPYAAAFAPVDSPDAQTDSMRDNGGSEGGEQAVAGEAVSQQPCAVVSAHLGVSAARASSQEHQIANLEGGHQGATDMVSASQDPYAAAFAPIDGPEWDEHKDGADAECTSTDQDNGGTDATANALRDGDGLAVGVSSAMVSNGCFSGQRVVEVIRAESAAEGASTGAIEAAGEEGVDYDDDEAMLQYVLTQTEKELDN